MGIWDILRGAKELRGGISHDIRASAKELAYQIDVMLGAYNKLMEMDPGKKNTYSKIVYLPTFLYSRYTFFVKSQKS